MIVPQPQYSKAAHIREWDYRPETAGCICTSPPGRWSGRWATRTSRAWSALFGWNGCYAPTTLNNFLNRQSKTLGGLAVALACTVVDLVCDGKTIGRSSQNLQPEPENHEGQLVLEFDDAFEFQRETKYPTVVLRKPPARHDSLRLVIRRIS